MFIKVRKVTGYDAKIKTDSVIMYEKWNESTQVTLENGDTVRFTEPNYEEFEEIMDPYPNESTVDKVKKWLTLGAAILIIILLVKAIFFD